MSNILDNVLDNNPTLNTIILIIMILAIALSFAFMLNKISFKIVLSFIALILIFLDAWDVIPSIFGAVGFVLMGLMVAWALHGGSEK